MNTNRQKKEIEDFFKLAFCGESAEVIVDTKEFELQSVVKIVTGDKRGTIHIGVVKKS